MPSLLYYVALPWHTPYCQGEGDGERWPHNRVASHPMGSRNTCRYFMLYPGKKLARIQVESCPFESHSGFQVTGMIEGLFGFKIFHSRIFFRRKFCQVYFVWVAWFKKGLFWVFKTIWRFVVVPTYFSKYSTSKLVFKNLFFVLYNLMLLKIFKARKFGMGFLGG